MGNSNDNTIKDFFNYSKLIDFSSRIGGVCGKFGSFAENILNNMMKLSTNIGNSIGTSYFSYKIIGGVFIFVGIRTKMI